MYIKEVKNMEDSKYLGPAPTKSELFVREIIVALNGHAEEYLHNGPLYADIALNYKNIIIDVYEHPNGKIEIYAYDVNKPEPFSPHQCVRISLDDGKDRNSNGEKIDSLLSELDFRDWNIERGTPWHLDDSKLIARIEGHTLKSILLEKNDFYKIEDNKVPKWADEATHTAKIYDYESQKRSIENKILPLEQAIIESIEERKNDKITGYTPEKGWHDIEPKISPDKISYALGITPVEKHSDGDSYKGESTFVIYAYDRDGEYGKPGRIIGCYHLDATTPKIYAGSIIPLCFCPRFSSN